MANYPNINELRHFVDVESLYEIGESKDRGQRFTQWHRDYLEIPAAIITLGGRELENARQLVQDANYLVKIRWHNLNTKQRFVWRKADGSTLILNIGHIDNIEQRNLWELCICGKGINGE